MGCSERCREEFRCSNFGLNYRYSSRFVRFEFGWPKLYLVWRGVMAAYHVAMIILTGFLGTETWTRTQDDTVKWFIYLTHWMFFILTLCTVIEFITVLYSYLTRLDIFSDDAYPLPVFLRITWVWQNLANNISILTSLLFWALLYGPTYPLTNMDIITHAGNTIYVLINLAVTASPLRFLHFFHTSIAAVIFVIFSVIYQQAGGTNGLGRNYIYSVLDWTSPGTAALYSILSVCVGVPVVQLILWLLFLLRVKLYEKCLSAGRSSDVEMAGDKVY